MLQNKKQHFIVIDDSKLDCFIAEKIIKNTGKCESVISFQQATEALAFLITNEIKYPYPTIILVDIQMPVMNGFQFVEAFEKLPLSITSKYSIYIISSSINDDDLNRVHNYHSIKQFLNKPLTSNNLSLLLTKD
ncbi:MAG: response regulator [Taibaiella sp.]|nr:response regulator [Taibaiella sp.]